MSQLEKRPETVRGALIEAIFYGKDRLCYVAIVIAMLGVFPHVMDGLVSIFAAVTPSFSAASAAEETK